MTNDSEPDDNAQGNSKDENEPGESENRPVGTLEKIASTVSALLIAGLLAVLLWDAFHPNTEPSFTTQLGKVALVSGSYHAPVTVKNSGDESAKEVVVHVELLASDSVLAESDVTIDWLPGNSSRKVVGVFSRPASGLQPTGVRAEVHGYATP
jgi:uncharacterized protein (TIGR02588 family)